MKIFITAPHSLAGYFLARSIRISIKQCIKAFIAALILIFAGNAYAIEVGLAIENDLDSNGNITVVNGSKVKVAYTVIEDTDRDLNRNDKIQLVRVDGDKVVASVVRGKKKSGTVSLKVKSEEEQLYVRYVRKTGTEIERISHPSDPGYIPLLSISKASLADLTVGLNALITSQAGQVIALPNTCIQGQSNQRLYADMNTSTPPGNAYGPGIVSANRAPNSNLDLFCPIPLQVPPGASVTITGAVFNNFDNGTNCRVQGEIRVKTFGTASWGTIVSTVYSGANAGDFAYTRTGPPEPKAFPTFSRAIDSNTIVWVYVRIGHNSTGGGDCRYLGARVDYTTSRP